MALDVDAPDPPELDPVRDAADEEDGDGGGEYRREDLEYFLAEEGAWERAFGDWAEHTDLDEEEFAVVRDLELVRHFDFFWDAIAQRVGYHAPGIPEDWRERDLHEGLESWGTVSGINAAMAELGRIVSDVLTDEYVDWGEEETIGEDLPDFE